QFLLSPGIVAHLRRRHTHEVLREIGSAGVRIILGDRRKLLVRLSGSLVHGSKTGIVRLRRHAGGPYGLVEDLNSLSEVDAGLLVLFLEVVPAADRCRNDD